MEETPLLMLLGLTIMGGMLGSLGISTLLRSQHGRAFVTRWKWWGLVLYATIVLTLAAVLVVWAYRLITRSPSLDGSLGSPWPFLAFGVAAGLPFTLFTAIAVRYQARQLAERRRKRKLKPATRQERAEFAKKLESQLRQYSSDLHSTSVQARGDQGRVIEVCGNVDREQAERLVSVLRAELQDLGVERVESGDSERNWWVKV